VSRRRDWHPGDVSASDVTPERVYLNRAQFLKAMGLAAAGLSLPGRLLAKSPFDTSETVTPYDYVSTYNNFYEFGTEKDLPAKRASTLKPRPWTVEIGGLCDKPKIWDVESLIKKFPAEERIYRHRCVEAWSIVVPWLGFPLAPLLKAAEPKASAKFVALQTLMDPKQMPGEKTDVLAWPYVEGLRLDEALHPLTMLTHGMYGKPLPNQNGAPLRLTVPWKYGFKSIKSVVKIAFTAGMPPTAWNKAAPEEYGFYSNVNPSVDHPRWSQKKERRLGELFKRKTLMFNGYEDQVAGLYKGMDLQKWF